MFLCVVLLITVLTGKLFKFLFKLPPVAGQIIGGVGERDAVFVVDGEDGGYAIG